MSEPTPPLLPLRTAVILALSVLCGALIGVLTALAQHNLPAGVLAGVVSTGAGVVALNKLVS